MRVMGLGMFSCSVPYSDTDGWICSNFVGLLVGSIHCRFFCHFRFGELTEVMGLALFSYMKPLCDTY